MDIFEIYKKNADPEQAVSMANYMKNVCPFLGIPKPKRAELSKSFLKEAKSILPWIGILLTGVGAWNVSFNIWR